MKRKYNSEGLKMMFGGACSFNEKALPPSKSCAFCEHQLRIVGKTHFCVACKSLFIRQDNGLLNYLGKTNERARGKKTS